MIETNPLDGPPAKALSGPRDGAAAAAISARWGSLFFRFRDGLFPAVFFGLALLSRPLRPWGDAAADRWLNLLGIALALSGQVLRALVIGFAYIQRGGRDRRIYATELQQSGVFAHSRNPLYLGNILALLGFSVIHNSWLCYLVGVPFFLLAYRSIVAAEEEYLQRRFGAAYDDYTRRVPRFWPRWHGFRATVADLRFDGRKLLRKEYGATTAGILAIVFLLAWDAYRFDGAAGLRPLRLVASVGLTILAAAYLAVRALKKSGRLGLDPPRLPPVAG